MKPTAEVTFDVIIVGGRCAGAALAIHLARAGLSVVVIESAPLPSGQPTSTHLIQPPGIDELDLLASATKSACPRPHYIPCACASTITKRTSRMAPDERRTAFAVLRSTDDCKTEPATRARWSEPKLGS